RSGQRVQFVGDRCQPLLFGIGRGRGRGGVRRRAGRSRCREARKQGRGGDDDGGQSHVILHRAWQCRALWPERSIVSSRRRSNMSWLILALLVGLVLWAVGIYNGLVMARNAYKNAFAQIDVQLTRRYDLIPNLVEVAKQYMAHERTTLEAVIQARNSAVS